MWTLGPRSILVAGLVVAASNTEAGWIDGNKLQGWCVEGRNSFALGYVAGVADRAMNDEAVVVGSLLAHKFTEGPGPLILDVCIPEGVILQQLVDVVCQYVNEHPESRQGNGADLVHEATQKSWPCPSPPANK